MDETLIRWNENELTKQIGTNKYPLMWRVISQYDMSLKYTATRRWIGNWEANTANIKMYARQH